MTDVSSPPLYASMTLGLVDVDMLLFVQVMILSGRWGKMCSIRVLDAGGEDGCGVGEDWIAREGTN